MPGNALFVYEGEAEAAFARGLDVAVQRCESGSQGLNGRLNLMLCGHVLLDISCEVRCKAVKLLISIFRCACHKSTSARTALSNLASLSSAGYCVGWPLVLAGIRRASASRLWSVLIILQRGQALYRSLSGVLAGTRKLYLRKTALCAQFWLQRVCFFAWAVEWGDRYLLDKFV